MKTRDPFDRLLERAARPRDSARAAGDCLDAETLAAWADGSLTAAQRDAVELHTADCERCLAMVAAFAKTAPPPVEAQRSSWFSLRWLVPITAAVVVVGVWALVQNRPEENRQVVLNAPPPAVDALTPAPAAPPPPAQERNIAAQGRGDAPAAKKAQPTLAARSRQAPAETPRRDEARDKQKLLQGQTADRVAAAAASPTPPPPAAASPVVPPPMGSTQPAAMQETVANAAAAGRGGAAQGALATSVVVRSPDPNILWRFPGADIAQTFRSALAAPALAKSLDGGRTWTPQPITGFEALRSGAAPAPNVCWLVGRNGTVLLTTNGTTWQQVPFPDLKADLVAVTARDALSATVTTADGRTYHTDDGGKTWRLQENPAAAF